MTSIVKKVLRSGSGKKYGNKKDQLSPLGPAKPISPPSPDLSGLTHEEITILKDVLKRQEEFENEETNRKEKLREDLISYEESVKRQASQKGKLKHVDLRLCRLCYKTKFADGIGKACYDCHKRVCNRCGSFSRPRWNPKKNKSVKGKWRCNMCQMKRDVLAKTGIWYHGSQEGQPAFPPKFLQKKLSLSEMDSSENDGSLGTGTVTNPEFTCLEAEGYEREQDSDIFSDNHTPKTGRAPFRRSRRRSNQSEKDTEDPEEDMYIDDEQFQKERQLCRKQRHNRKYRRRERTQTSSISSEKEVDWFIDGGTDSDRINDTSDGAIRVESNEFDSSTDNLLSSDRDTKDKYQKHSYSRRDSRKERTTNDNGIKRGREKEYRRESVKYKRNDVPPYEDSSHRHKSESTEQRMLCQARGVTDVRQYEGISRTRSDPRLRDLRREEHHKRSNSDKRSSIQTDNDSFDIGRPSKHSDGTELRGSRSFNKTKTTDAKTAHKTSVYSRADDDAVYYSSSSSIVSDVRSPEMRDFSSNHSSLRNVLSPSTLSPYQGFEEKECSAQHLKPSNNRREVLTQSSPVSTNCLSPDMALIRHSGRRKHRMAYGASRDNSISPSRQRPLSASPIRGQSASKPGGTSPTVNEMNYQEARVDSHGRRMTLSHCENILLSEDTSFRHRNSLKSTKPHDILLHRDKTDLSQRTYGFGMRVVGGKKDESGTLGAYVTMVTSDGPASTQGINIGDHITEWNGRSLVNATFEEAQEIMRQSGDIVQVTVIHRNTESDDVPHLKNKRPIIVRADTLQEMEIHPPENLVLSKPKRRMLPKTPIEIKRNVKTISGRIWMQLDYDVKCQCILVVLIRGEKIMSLDGENRRGPNPVAMIHLLPGRAHHIPKETEIKFNTFDPDWNETFVFPNICEEELASLSMEITIWNYKEVEDEFLGEVLLDLSEARIDNTPTCYHLEDHDENSSPLPYRKKSFSLSDGSAISPVTSADASSLYPSLNPSPRSSVSTKATGSQRTLPITPAHDKMRELIGQGKRDPGRERHELSSSAHSSPAHSPHSEDGLKRRNSFTSIVRKKVHALTRLSSSLILGSKKEQLSDSSFNRSQSYGDVTDQKYLETPSPAMPRRSFEGPPKRYDLLAPPHPLSRSNSSKDFFSDGDKDDDPLKSPNPGRVPPEGDDITSLLGPGQVLPKPSLETIVLGDIKMGFMVSKGQLEIDIIVVKGLSKSGLLQPPDTYVKTYLVEGAKTVQKKKTHTVKMSFDPIFRKKIKYSACNIHGRCIKVNVWEKQKTFDKKNCLGEAMVKLDNLDLCQHTMAWYKLFPSGAMDYGSNESLTFW